MAASEDGAGSEGAESAKAEASKLLNDFQDIGFGQIALIVAGSIALIWAVRRILPYLADRGPSRARLLVLGAVPVIRLLVIVGAVLWIIPLVFNITVQNFFVIAGSASVALGFAFKDYASSLIAGVVAIFERPYGAGDWVEIDGDYGEVVSMGLRALRLRTADDNEITVPHGTLWTDNISNANSGARTLMCVAHFHLLPDHDPAAIRRALTDVALTSAYLDYAEPVLVVMEENEHGSHYRLKAYPFDLRDQFLFITDMTARGKAAVRRVGAREVAAMAVSRTGEGRGEETSD